MVALTSFKITQGSFWLLISTLACIFVTILGNGYNRAENDRTRRVPSATKKITSRKSREFINAASDLNATEFDHARWHNAETGVEDQMDWENVRDGVNAKRVYNLTDTRAGLDLPAAGVQAEKAMRPGDQAWLLSCPIRCQRDTGNLKFRWWKTADVKVQVCTRNLGDQATSVCYSTQYVDSDGISIPGQQRPFEIIIEASGFTEKGQFVLLDNLEYSADVCPASDQEKS